MFQLIAAVLAGLLLTGCVAPGSSPSYRRISMEEAASIMENQSEYIILDVRTQEEYRSGHIPGAICIPNETINSNVASQLPNPDALILVYCRSGNRSRQAAQKLSDLGYTNIAEFGGILDWTGEIVS